METGEPQLASNYDKLKLACGVQPQIPAYMVKLGHGKALSSYTYSMIYDQSFNNCKLLNINFLKRYNLKQLIDLTTIYYFNKGNS